ncbi:MAG: flippase-like domain-containing protein [Proteobacteria bacterium]|nr:flippase-like domain-containing protein [Pseudomonadota bacterium]MBU6425584.1 flippase-like domain-containing protein [Rhodospirillales bacterium]MDE2240023.1 flippase-like domain-containing protein [Rhodospirillales bacterium]
MLTLAGLAVITGLVIYFGAGDVLHALTSVSASGLAMYIAAQLALLLGLGGSWRMLLRSRQKGSFLLCVWGRAVRDATGEFLPFSQVGGYVIGARVMTLGGVATADAAASTLGDITTEFLAQLVFVGTGLVILSRKVPGSDLLLPVTIGLAVAVALGVGLIVAQRGAGTRLFRGLALRIAGTTGQGAAENVQRLQKALDGMYTQHHRLAWAASFHLACWFGTGTASYIGFQALGVNLSWLDAVCIEAMLHAIMALAFFIPGRVGVQEAAYTLLGGLFGIPPDIALSLSLLRRARDFVIAVPVLIVWQGLEARQLKLNMNAG